MGVLPIAMGNKGGFTIAKLGDSNYRTWKTDMIDVLLSENLWFIVCGEDKEPAEDQSEENKAAWKARSARAAANIRLGMDDEIRARYTDEKYRLDPVALWKKVEEDQKAVIALDKNLLQEQLYETKLGDYGTVSLYVDAVNTIIDNLKACRETVGEDDQWFYIFQGLPASWSVYRRVVEGTNAGRGVQQLISEMLAEEAQLKRERGISADSPLYTRETRKGSGKGNSGTMNTYSSTSNHDSKKPANGCLCGKNGRKRNKRYKNKTDQAGGRDGDDASSGNKNSPKNRGWRSAADGAGGTLWKVRFGGCVLYGMFLFMPDLPLWERGFPN